MRTLKIKETLENNGVQKLLLDLGYEWRGGGFGIKKDAKFLYLFDDGTKSLGYGNTLKFFNKEKSVETKLVKDTKIARKVFKTIIAEKDGYILTIRGLK